MSNRTSFLISLIVFSLSAYCLLTGSEILLVALIDKPYLPLGNLITWAGMVALPASIYFSVSLLNKPRSQFERILSVSCKISLMISALWAPVSFLLAGNLSNSFSSGSQFQGGQTAMKIFWTYSYVIVILSLSILLLTGFNALIKYFYSKQQKNENAS